MRVRPEEVAATGMFNDFPATFEQLAPAGAWIISQIPPRRACGFRGGTACWPGPAPGHLGGELTKPGGRPAYNGGVANL